MNTLFIFPKGETISKWTRNIQTNLPWYEIIIHFKFFGINLFHCSFLKGERSNRGPQYLSSTHKNRQDFGAHGKCRCWGLFTYFSMRKVSICFFLKWIATFSKSLRLIYSFKLIGRVSCLEISPSWVISWIKQSIHLEGLYISWVLCFQQYVVWSVYIWKRINCTPISIWLFFRVNALTRAHSWYLVLLVIMT